MDEHTPININIPSDALALVVKSDGTSEVFIPDTEGELHPNQALLFGAMMFFDLNPDHPTISEIYDWMAKDLSDISGNEELSRENIRIIE